MPGKRAGVRIVLSAPLTITTAGKRVRDPAILRQLDDLTEADESLVEYLDEANANLGLGGGYLRCVYDADKLQVRLVTEFDAPSALSKQQLRDLVGDTEGQWLDGVGESFFDDFCAFYECSVEIGSPTRVTQEAGKAWRPGKRAKTTVDKPREPRAATGDVKALSKKLLAATSVKPVQQLLDAGADPNCFDSDGDQPLHLERMLNQPKVVRLLLDHGATVDGKAKETQQTPLMVAADFGYLAAVKLLLAAGASVQTEDAAGRTALDHAAQGIPINDIRPNPAVIVELLKAGARATPTTLEAAASQTSAKIVQMILDAGAAPSPQALAAAVEQTNPAVVQMILDAGVNASSDALAIAIYMGNTRAVKLLLAAGANPNCMVYQQTALQAAVRAGNTAIVRMLKKAGAENSK